MKVISAALLDAYLTVARPYCEGITPDGCELDWQLVNFADGGGAYQCVQYCPRPGAQPPPQAASLAPPPPLPSSGACEVTIYSEPNLAGRRRAAGAEPDRLAGRDRLDRGEERRVGLLHRRELLGQQHAPAARHVSESRTRLDAQDQLVHVRDDRGSAVGWHDVCASLFPLLQRGEGA